MYLNSDYYYSHWSDKAGSSIEDDMAAEIQRLNEEVTTLKATLIMVRRVVGSIELGSRANANTLVRLLDALGDVA